MVAVTVKPRDIIFTFPNSCNCCTGCLSKKVSKDKHVYVNSTGKLESYSKRKARIDVESSFKRAQKHLHETLTRKVRSFNGNPIEFQFRVNSILESITGTGRINLEHIDGINSIMLEYLTEKSRSE